MSSTESKTLASASDHELLALLRKELSTCVLSDVLGQLGFGCQLLPPQIRPLHMDMKMAGRAMPALDEAPTGPHTPERFGSKAFGLLIESIESLRPNEVYIANGGPTDVARLGDVLIFRAKLLGAAGVVINAHIRNALRALQLEVPTFALGSYGYGLQQRHNVVDYRCPVTIGNVRIKPGDLIFGDVDGVCVVPQHVEKEVVERAIARSQLENKLRRDVGQGQSLFDVFKSIGAR